MEIQYRSHIKDRNGVTFIAIINPVPNIFDTGEYSYNFDKSPFEEEERSSSSLWDDEDD